MKNWEIGKTRGRLIEFQNNRQIWTRTKCRSAFVRCSIQHPLNSRLWAWPLNVTSPAGLDSSGVWLDHMREVEAEELHHRSSVEDMEHELRYGLLHRHHDVRWAVDCIAHFRGLEQVLAARQLTQAIDQLDRHERTARGVAVGAEAHARRIVEEWADSNEALMRARFCAAELWQRELMGQEQRERTLVLQTEAAVWVALMDAAALNGRCASDRGRWGVERELRAREVKQRQLEISTVLHDVEKV